MFGTAARNTIIGPASYQADASVVRDVRLNGRNTISIQVQATNLFNSVRFGSIDTVLNSPDVRSGHVDAADADGAADPEIPVLMVPVRKSLSLLFVVGRCRVHAAGAAAGLSIRCRPGRGRRRRSRRARAPSVRDLTASDFEVREDNRTQQVTSFDVEEITTTAATGPPPPQILATGAVRESTSVAGRVGGTSAAVRMRH